MAGNKEELKQKMNAQEKAIEDHVNTIKRIQAEFENYMKRVEKEREQFASYTNHKLITKLLGIVDDFEKAVAVAKNQGGEVAEGINLIHKNFKKLLDEEGVREIKSNGAKLDPYKHEVIDIVNGEKDDIVVEELQKGYMLKDKILRTSKVRISKIGSGGKNE